jgi:hypothetical protein
VGEGRKLRKDDVQVKFGEVGGGEEEVGMRGMRRGEGDEEGREGTRRVR